MKADLINKLAAKWQISLNSLPSHHYIGNRDNQYICVNNSQNTTIIRSGLNFSHFEGQVPKDMPRIIANKKNGVKASTIKSVWNNIHSNNEKVMAEKKRLAFIELWPCNNTDIQITYSIKHPILDQADVIGYLGKSINIRSTNLQNIFHHAQINQQLSWLHHHIIHQDQAMPLQEHEARAICYFLTGNNKLLLQSTAQAHAYIDKLKMQLRISCQIQLIQTLLSGSILKNTLEILQNENL